MLPTNSDIVMAVPQVPPIEAAPVVILHFGLSNAPTPDSADRMTTTTYARMTPPMAASIPIPFLQRATG